MAAPTKAELLEEAKAKNLDVSDENTVAEIKEALANAEDNGGDNGNNGEQGSGDGEQVVQSSDAENRVTGDEEPFSGDVKSPDELRDPQIAGVEGASFDERTGVQQPWLRKDGTQDNGAEDVRGARAAETRAE